MWYVFFGSRAYLYTMRNRMKTLKTEPDPIKVDPVHAAVCVVDMQNWDVKPGGLFEKTGVDITHGQRVVDPIRSVLDAARRYQVPVIYLQNMMPRDRKKWPKEDSPWYWKGGMHKYRDDPSFVRGLAVEGEWGAEIIDELSPTPEDYVVRKTLYSGFVRTELDSLLRSLGVRTIFFTGIGTPTCVEATARDAYFHGYWSVVLEDCCGGIMRETHEQALAAIKRRYGFVCSSGDFIDFLELQKLG
jgi:ureidoacrylate peracid hydrolase